MNVRTAEGWAEYHATCFAITAPSDIDGVLSWARTFVGAGVPVEDLVAATDWMVLHVAPEWRREHLAHIQAFLQKLRLSRLADFRQAEAAGRGETGAFCARCDDTGFVPVPHPKDIAGGEWGGKYECVVACRCGRGDAVRNGFATRNIRLRSLPDYEASHPDWQDMMARKAGHARAMAEREGEAAHADKTAGPIVRRLTGRFSMPKK